MHTLPFRQPGRFYRGNLHTHSTRSDGALTPEAVVDAYRSHSYDSVALTDHFLERFGYPITDTRRLRSADFTTLLGAELHAPRTESGLDWHLVAVGLPIEFAPPSPTEAGPALVARAAAHFLSSRPAAFAGWVQVRATELTPAALVEALRAGAYYSSQGPEIYDIAVGRGQIAISCSPAAAIIVSGANVHACQAHGESLTSALFPLAGFAGSYCRVTIVDGMGKRAWSNPMWLDDSADESE